MLEMRVPRLPQVASSISSLYESNVLFIVCSLIGRWGGCPPRWSLDGLFNFSDVFWNHPRASSLCNKFSSCHVSRCCDHWFSQSKGGSGANLSTVCLPFHVVSDDVCVHVVCSVSPWWYSYYRLYLFQKILYCEKLLKIIKNGVLSGHRLAIGYSK